MPRTAYTMSNDSDRVSQIRWAAFSAAAATGGDGIELFIFMYPFVDKVAGPPRAHTITCRVIWDYRLPLIRHYNNDVLNPDENAKSAVQNTLHTNGWGSNDHNDNIVDFLLQFSELSRSCVV